MSVDIMSAAFKAQIPDQEYTDKKGNTKKVKSATLKFILVALADHASDTGESVYPSIDHLQKKTSMGSCATCVAAIRCLKNLGILTHVGNRIKGNKEYRISLSKILEFHPVKSTVSPSEKESSLTIPEPSLKPIATGKTPVTDIKRACGFYDPDEVEKRKKKKVHKKHNPLLEPKTKGERILFGMLQAEIKKSHPEWRLPGAFPSFACKELFGKIEGRLNGDLRTGINAGLIKGILSVENLVKYVNEWQPKGAIENPMAGARVTA